MIAGKGRQGEEEIKGKEEKVKIVDINRREGGKRNREG